MNHERTIICFQNKGNSYRVEYDYGHTAERNVRFEKEGNSSEVEYEFEELQARVFENEECIKLFNPLPSTKTNNPTKSQAKELIMIALKDIKNRKKYEKSPK